MSIVNIKTLEAARYAAWEMTAIEVSDYATHKHDLDNKVHSLKDPATNLTLGYSYYGQVERMMFAGLFADGSGLDRVFSNLSESSVVETATNYISKKLRLPWRPVVRSYAMKNYNGHASGCDSSQRNVKGCVSFSSAASYSDAGAPPKVFYTNAYKDHYAEDDRSPYLKVYGRQSPKNQNATDAKTGYYLGRGKAQMLDRSKCWTD